MVAHWVLDGPINVDALLTCVTIVEVKAGDVGWCPAGHKHRHGANSTTAMTYLAITKALDGKNVVWLEEVMDGKYKNGPGKADGFDFGDLLAMTPQSMQYLPSCSPITIENMSAFSTGRFQSDGLTLLLYYATMVRIGVGLWVFWSFRQFLP